MRKLIWSEPAVNDLQAISDFISKDSEYYARIVIAELIDAVEKLNDFSEIGRIVPEYQRQDIRELIHENHRLIHQVTDESIIILTVINTRQLLSNHYELNNND